MTSEENNAAQQSTAVGVAALFEKAERVYTEHVEEGLKKKEEIIQEAESEKARILQEAQEEADAITANAHMEAENATDLARQQIENDREEFSEQEKAIKERIASLMAFEKKYREALSDVVATNDYIVEGIYQHINSLQESSKEIYRYLDMEEIFETNGGNLIPRTQISSLPSEEESEVNEDDTVDVDDVEIADVELTADEENDLTEGADQETSENDSSVDSVEADGDAEHIADIGSIEETQEDFRARENTEKN